MKVPLTFISTLGALSNLGFNAYQQDTINDVLDDLDSKSDLIDSIHNKGKSFIFIIEDIDLTIFFQVLSSLTNAYKLILNFSYWAWNSYGLNQHRYSCCNGTSNREPKETYEYRFIHRKCMCTDGYAHGVWYNFYN